MIASSFAAGSHLGPIHGSLVAVAVVVMAAGDARGAWTDNFDNYANGSTILTQGDWVGWHQVGTEDTIVDDAQASSAPHSLQMGGEAVVDLVPQFTGATSGIWYLDVMTYVPATSNSKSSDIGFLARHTGFQGAGDTQWFGPFTLNMETGMANDTVPIVRDKWIPMRTVFDIDAQTYDIHYNGVLASSGSFDGRDHAVVGLDPWTPAGASTLYYDDFRMAPAIPEPTPTVTVTEISHLASGNELRIRWESSSGFLYNIRSQVPPATESEAPLDWPILIADMEATPPLNSSTIPLPADPTRLFVVESFQAPPVSVFSVDFESGAEGWAFGSDGAAGTAWELGVPTNGPATANSLVNCFGTNLASDYGINADVWLRSPAIDLTTAGGATLNYFQYRDIEEGFDFGIISVLDAADDSLIAEIPGIDSGAFAWELVSKSIPAEALGKMIKIEFRMTSDEIETFPGLFIDDFEVTVP